MIQIYEIKNKRKKLIGEFPKYIHTLGDIDSYSIFCDEELYDALELDEKYYLIESSPWTIIGVLSLRKGWTFTDTAEYDERLIIKGAFPDKICHVIGE